MTRKAECLGFRLRRFRFFGAGPISFVTGGPDRRTHSQIDLEHRVVQFRTPVTELRMKGNKTRPIKWRRWHSDAFAALRHMRGLKSFSALPMASEAQATARQLLEAAACYHALSALAGPEDYWELSYLQRVEYSIDAHIAALDRLGWSLCWASEPEGRSVILAFLPRKQRCRPNKRREAGPSCPAPPSSG